MHVQQSDLCVVKKEQGYISDSDGMFQNERGYVSESEEEKRGRELGIKMEQVVDSKERRRKSSKGKALAVGHEIRARGGLQQDLLFKGQGKHVDGDRVSDRGRRVRWEQPNSQIVEQPNSRTAKQPTAHWSVQYVS